MRYILFLIMLWACTTTVQQESALLHNPDDILIGDINRPTVCLMGTFHFSYPGLDAHKTAEDDQVNIYSDKRQRELRDLIDYIKKFKPTKIAVEAGRNTGYLMYRKKEVDAGIKKRGRGEIDQVTFRLMDELKLDTLYGVDTPGLTYTLQTGEDSTCATRIIERIFADWDFTSPSEWDQRYDQFYDYDDQVALNNTILDYFKHMNHPKNISRYKGAYFIGDFKLRDYDGADALAMYWYTRNFRIARNIQNIITSPDDRVLVLIGAGHVGILEDIFRDSPEYEYIPFLEIGQ